MSVAVYSAGRGLCAVALLLLVAGCAGPTPIRDWSATLPSQPPMPEPAAANGAIYQAATGLALFEDVKARRVGDTLIVQLAERTNAETSATTSTGKGTSSSIANPTLFGEEFTRGDGLPLFQSSLESSHDFDGEGDSAQSNRVDGNIAVTVYQRLPNGNLVVRGEKWITINQGREFLRVAGIVRPADIGAGNSVPSYKLADAQIEYSGKGALADANRPGWLSRFFQSPIFPF
ncbi:flagellar basal body L-ring protein FlgH [Kineobactrum sediminis]|uniref:Flagellar L-ring protein n=1 Tax=Kineobactrum sediminis TaxID=1905677 RepID=A0A2N5Y6G7_9GAMM|nr:flagellar basal body L-ring protein FlgH [Kineobactrum sediminis]PLW83988.1 flagellar basal body L-ring protein FlgH [Kineobactrum sediminis]